MTFYLGVDGGGTTTRAAVIDGDGRVVALSVGPTTNPFSTGSATAMANLHAIVSDVLLEAGAGPVERAVFALAGISTREDCHAAAERIRGSAVAAIAPDFSVTNDTVAALWSARVPLPAIVLVAGTGSHCIGVTRTGTTARALGLEYVLSDDGSAFDIGLRTLRAVVRACDGRGPSTQLTPMVARALGAVNLSEVFRHVHAFPSMKTSIAELAPLADRAAAKGDPAAQLILQAAGESLTGAIESVAESLALSDVRFELVLLGGVVHHSACIRESILQYLARRHPLAVPHLLETNGSIGAARLALENVGIDIWTPYERPIASDDPGPSNDPGGR